MVLSLNPLITLAMVKFTKTPAMIVNTKWKEFSRICLPPPPATSVIREEHVTLPVAQNIVPSVAHMTKKQTHRTAASLVGTVNSKNR